VVKSKVPRKSVVGSEFNGISYRHSIGIESIELWSVNRNPWLAYTKLCKSNSEHAKKKAETSLSERGIA
jgi:hypothetical protein